jgi:cytochrome c biogenesis protein CcdA
MEVGYLVTVAGLTGGLNPCALGLMMTFLGYLMVFGGKKNGDRGVLAMGGLYLFGVVLMYVFLGLVFYRLAYDWQRSVVVDVVKYSLFGVLFAFGLIQISEGVWPKTRFKLEMPKMLSVWFGRLMKRMSGPISVLVGSLTTLIAAPCTLPGYVGMALVLTRSSMAPIRVLMYFLYYNLLIVLPSILVLVLVYKGKQITEMKEWGHRWERLLKILGGVMLLFLSWWVIK